MPPLTFPRLRWAGIGTMVLALSACGDQRADDTDFSLADNGWMAALGNDNAGLPPLPDAEPMMVADQSAPQAPYRAPLVEQLPATEPIAYAQPQGASDYAWIDRADMFAQTLGDAPPDYGFAYDNGVTPWAWQSSDDYVRYAEPIDGGYRYYYYEPGAASPWLVSDPWYSYGYRDDRLVAVYDRGGRALPWREARARDAYAARYHARARDMRRVARARERQRIEARQWAAQRAAIRRDRERWREARQTQTAWARYRDNRAEARARRHWAAERQVRERAAVRFANWQREDFRGDAPRFYAEQRRERQMAARRAQAQRQRQQRAQAERRVERARHDRMRDRQQMQQRRAQAEQRAKASRRRAEQRQAQAQRADRQQRDRQRARQLAEQREGRAAQQRRRTAQQRQVQQRKVQQRQAVEQRQQRAVRQAAARQRATRQREAEAGRVQRQQRAQARRSEQQQAAARTAREQAQQARAKREQATVRADRQEARTRQNTQRQQQAQQREARQQQRQQAQQRQARQQQRQQAQQRRPDASIRVAQGGGKPGRPRGERD